MALKQLGILELGKICPNETAIATFDACITQIIWADRLGFSRFWLAEHHESTRMCATPLMLLPLLGKATTQIRIGTAGIILPLHIPIDMAESFSFLQMLFPGRVDCGLASGLPEPMVAYEYGAASLERSVFNEEFDKRFARFIKLILKQFPEGHRLNKGVSPIVSTIPDIWLMGVTGGKRTMASRVGAYFSYSLMHKRSRCDPGEIQAYFQDFCPGLLEKPFGNVAVRVACAETSREARAIKMPDGLMHPQVSGNPQECLEQLDVIANTYYVDEIIIHIEGRTAEEKIRGCQLIGDSASFLRK